MAFPVTLNGRTYTLTDFEGTNYVDGLPDAFEDFVTHAGDIYNSTSTTSNSIGTGSKTFTVESNKPYQAGTPLRIADAAAPSTNFLDTVVTSYSGTTLVVNSIGYGGSGTKTSWTVNIGGAKTVDGTLGLSQGGTGATDAAGARTNIDVYSKADADSRFLNVSGEASDVSITGHLTVDGGEVLIGTTTLDTNFSGSGVFQLAGENDAPLLQVTRYQANSSGPYLRIGKSRGTSASTRSIVSDGDALGYLQFIADDGNDMNHSGAQIAVEIDGTPGENDLPGRMRFYTTSDGASSPTERMRINNAGDISMSGSSGTVGTVKGNGTLTLSDNHGGNIGGGLAFHYTGNGGYSEIYVENNNTLVLNADPTAAGSNTSIKFRTDDALAAMIDSSQRVLIGLTSDVTGTGHKLQVNDDVTIMTFDGTTTGADGIRFIKSRASTPGSNTIVADGDDVGFLDFRVDDGTDYASRTAVIASAVDGTPGTNDTPGRLSFYTTSDGSSAVTERMRIENNGDVRLGVGGGGPIGPKFYGGTTSTGSNGLGIWPEGDGASSVKQAFYVNSTASRIIVRFINPNGVVGAINTSGSSTSYATSSDYRLKENVAYSWDATTRLKQLKPARFNFIADDTTTVDGFIAHEVQTVVPEAVTGSHNEVDDEGNPVYQGIDHGKLVPLLVKTIQELEARITALETP